ASDYPITSTTEYIYAYAAKPPRNPDLASSSFSIHDSYDVLGPVDFTTTKGGAGTIAPGPGATGPDGAGGSGSAGSVASPGGSGSACIPGIYCVYSEPDGKGSVYISLLSAASGWVSLGAGRDMSAATMIVGWRNTNGGYTVSDRVSSTQALPTVAQTSSVLVPLRVPQPSWAQLAFTVLKPLQSQDVTFTAKTNFIYAFSNTAPSDPDSPGSGFSIHDGRGTLGILDFTALHNGTTEPPTGSPSGTAIPGGTSDGSIGSTCISGVYCVFSQPDGNGNVYITLHGSEEGWVALGTGSTMAGSAMIVGWKNSSGGYTVSDRLSSTEAMPSPSTQLASQLVPLQVPAPSWARLAFSVLRPLKSNDVTYTATTSYIYALSSKAPDHPDMPLSPFAVHDKYGTLGVLDFTTAHTGVGSTNGDGTNSILKLPSGVDYITVVRLHGYVMIYAWVVCPFVGIFIARYMKDRLGHWWFRLHVGIMLFGCAAGTLGAILLVFLFKSGSHFVSSPSLHPLLGLLVFIIMILQMILGVVSDRLFSTDRTAVPWWDKMHWWAGRISVGLAVVTIWTGVNYAEYFTASAPALPVFFGLATGAGILAFAVGEKTIGQIRKPAFLTVADHLGDSDLEQLTPKPEHWPDDCLREGAVDTDTA
ncbi:hypothetical protein HDU91_007126, partial [Kappamyces sp. JEL0680]